MKSFAKINSKISDKQRSAQKLIYQLAVDLLNTSVEQSQETINHSLSLVGDFFGCDHIIIFEYAFNQGIFSATHVYPSSELTYLDQLKKLSIRAFQDPMIKEHQALNPYILADLSQLNQETALYQMLSSRNVKTIHSYPIMIDKHCVGSIVFEDLKLELDPQSFHHLILDLLLKGIANLWNTTKLNEKLYTLQIDNERAFDLKSQFLANMSHEIRTPLSGIYNAMYLLSSTDLSVEQKEYLDLGQSSIDALSSIIEDLLDISKMETGKMEVYQDTFNLEEELVRLIKTLKSFADEKGIQLIFKYDYKIVNDLIGDIQKIRQVLLNLLKNAVKFTETGSVTLEVKSINDQSQYAIQFSVIDTGIGMDEEDLKHVFEAFYQIDGSETKKQKGTGLGLSICHQLTELLQGELQIKSKPNQGSVFSLTIPLGKGKVNDYSFVNQMSALLIDPVNIAQSFKLMIQSMGIRVYDLNNIDDHHVDLLILDSTDHIEKVNEYQQQFGKERSINVICSYENAEQFKNIDLVFDLPTSRQTVYQRIVNFKNRESKQDEKFYNFINAYALIVDDNRLNRIALTNILKKLGMKSKSVESGKAAIETVKNESFDIILMDIQMPEMDGMEATRRIRSLGKSNQTVPIIAVTANAFLKDYDLMKVSQITDVIFKPIKPDSLTQLLRKYILVNNTIEIPSELFTFDQIEFEMRFEGSDDIAKEVLSTFQEEYKKDMIKIRQAVKNQDTEQIIHTAHYFKGSCSYLSAKRIVWLLDYMMNMAKTSRLEGMHEIVLRLDKEVDELVAIIKEYQT